MSENWSLTYKEYHEQSMAVGDVDPSYSMLRYLCERYELNEEQRYWLAFLYSTCYCGPTVFYIYNEFPDYENVEVPRLQRWWDENKSKLYFQTDRRWLRSRNQFVPMFESYREWLGGLTQKQKFSTMKSPDKFQTYENVFNEAGKIFQMGRFALFLYTESVFVVTGFPMEPRSMDMKTAESCRNGLAEAINRPDLNTHGTEKRLNLSEQRFLQQQFDSMVSEMRKVPGNTVWNIETTLCAYKKYKIKKRWVGYYLDRQAEEIEKMEDSISAGVDWSVLWQYRAETFDHNFLKEFR